MNEKNTQTLFRDFPALYRDAGKDCMHGIGCGDGWFALVYRLSAAIEAEAKKQGFDPQSEDWPCALQVKEKFGTLRFYVSAPAANSGEGGSFGLEGRGAVMSLRPIAANGPIRALVSAVEKESGSICEICGKPGTLGHDGGWWRVRCETKHKEDAFFGDLPDDLVP
jgi:hypothetical protein